MKNGYPVLNKDVVLLVQPSGGLIGTLGAPCQYINETAAEILELCDGAVTVEMIARILAERHDEHVERALDLVCHFLDTAVQKGHIIYSSEPINRLGTVAGNKEYYVPMDMSVDITSRCDLKCIHCYAEAGTQEEGLPTEELLKVLQKIRTSGVTKVVLTGGDPPARPDFWEILQFCAQQFLICDIATNGYRIDEEMAKKIVSMDKIGVITCRLSIDGREDTHDGIRGVRGSWRRAVKAVEVLSRHGIPVSVTMTLNSQNVDDLEDVVVTAKTRGASRFSAGMTLEKGRACGKNLELTKTQKEEVSRRLKELAQKYSSSTFYVSTWVGVSERDAPSDQKSVNCGAGYRMYSVDCLGNVKPCPAFDYAMGNIVTNDLEDIFGSPIVDFFTKLKWPTRERCGDCENFHICTECHAAALMKSKEIDTCWWADQWKTLPDGCENPFKSVENDLVR